jgi:hypothetical protein
VYASSNMASTRIGLISDIHGNALVLGLVHESNAICSTSCRLPIASNALRDSVLAVDYPLQAFLAKAYA